MTQTLKQLRQDFLELKQEVDHLKALVEEDYELADDVKEEIEASRRTPRGNLIPHDRVMREFGLR